MKLTAQLTYEKVRFDEAKDVHLVVSLAAPHLDCGAPRPPVCVIPVLDVSGSMRGEKLHAAQQSILELVHHLAPGDFCGVVVFSTEVETLAAPAELTLARRDELEALVGRLAARRNTNLGGGVLAGLDHAREARLPPGMLARVIVFTDGRANAGPARSREALRALLGEHLGEATLSAFGYGDDADQDLLRDLATAGEGNYAYVQGPGDALTAFGRELGGLLSTYARRIELTVSPHAGFVLTSVVSDVDAAERDGAVTIRIPDLLADEVRKVVLAGRLAPRAAPGGEAEVVAEVGATFEPRDAGGPARGRERARAGVRFVPAGEAQPGPAPSLDAAVALAELVRAQLEAEEAAAAGDFVRARERLVLFQLAARARGHEAIAAAAGKLATRVADAGAFARSGAYRSSLRSGGARGGVTSLYQREAVEDLRAMGQGRATAAQERMAGAFRAAPSERGPPRPSATGGDRLSPAEEPPSASGAGAARGGLARRRSRRW